MRMLKTKMKLYRDCSAEERTGICYEWWFLCGLTHCCSARVEMEEAIARLRLELNYIEVSEEKVIL